VIFEANERLRMRASSPKKTAMMMKIVISSQPYHGIPFFLVPVILGAMGTQSCCRSGGGATSTYC